MNFLAHLFLSDDTGESVVGNLLPDFVKVRDLSILHPAVREGVIRHRKVDAFVDTHCGFLACRTAIRHHCDHFSSILVDVWFDHLLAVNWRQWHRSSLNRFIIERYDMLTANANLMPPTMQRPIALMIEQDWLGSYATYPGMNARLVQMARRFHQRFGRTFDVGHACFAFARNYDLFEEQFAVLFDQLIERFALHRHPRRVRAP